MNLALDLAQRGVGRTSPNPAVGAVVVRDGEIVGRGFHTWANVKHAEIVALSEAGERAGSRAGPAREAAKCPREALRDERGNCRTARCVLRSPHQ